MLRILHTADWHLGLTFGQLDPHDSTKLARARLSVVDEILAIADQYDVAAVLCAGDIFDTPEPEADWWRGLAAAFQRRGGWTRPLILLPGNHDPLTRDSVYARGHAFRALLPPWVHVVDNDDFELTIGEDAVVYARPCRSTAGAEDLALALPARSEGDRRIRIGLVHGSTFDLPDHQTNFPIARNAAQVRGLDYLAIGDTHRYCVMADGGGPPTVYPGAPEPTSFKDREAGYVALATFRRSGLPPTVVQHRVGTWTWREETARSLADLERLASTDLRSTVIRLRLDMRVSLAEQESVEALVQRFGGSAAAHGLAGAFVVDRRHLRVEAQPDELNLEQAPETISEVARRLVDEAPSSEQARRALLVLHRLLHEVRS